MLTVHVGLHKTGSTSIQTVFGLERGHIRRKQVYLPWTDLFSGDGEIAAGNVTRIVALSKRGWHVVVSSEGALGAMSTAYPRASAVATQLAQLFQDIPLRVVIYLRPHPGWAASALGQHRREGGLTEPDTFARTLLASRGFHHATLVSDLSMALPSGSLVVRAYHPQLDVVDDLFSICDLGPVPPAFAGLRANTADSRRSVLRASPFSADTDEALHRHFKRDWALLLDDRLSTVNLADGDFRQLLEGEVRRPNAIPAADPPGEADPVADQTGQRPRLSKHARATAQRLAWNLRHGPRQLLLAGFVTVDARRTIPRHSRAGSANEPVDHPMEHTQP